MTGYIWGYFSAFNADYSFNADLGGLAKLANRNLEITGARMASSPKTPNPIDIHVGSRVRLRRTMLGMSQEKLGDSLGITFQQVQKYEKGANRIGASRLQQISAILKTPIAFFFEDAPGSHPGNAATGLAEENTSSYVVDFMSSTEGIHLNRAFAKIKDPQVRKRIIDLVRTLAEDEE